MTATDTLNRRRDDVATMPDSEGAPKKKSKKKLLLVVVLVLLLGGGAGGYLFLSGGDEPPPPPEPGAVVPLEAITVNLSGGHYLKIRIALQATADVHETPDGSKALDLVIAQFSNRPMSELSSSEARDQAKSELRKSIGDVYEHEVMDVYFTEFVMQ